MNVAEHLEQHLGPIERGWSAESLPGVQVCLFRDRPETGVFSLATLGLSNSILAMSGDRNVRQELLLAIRGDVFLDDLVKMLMHVAETLLARKRALLRGDVFPLGQPIGKGSAASALYSSIPVIFPESLATLRDSTPPTVFVWMIPLLASEAAFVESSGWSEFEDCMEAANPDLFDIARGSIV